MDGRYVPTVRKIPNYESSGLQGLEQNKTLVFNDDDANTPPVTPDASRPASFVDANGRLVTDNTVPVMANGQQVGTYELDPNTGQVTFKPIKTFYGTPDPVVIQVSEERFQRSARLRRGLDLPKYLDALHAPAYQNS